MKVEDSGEAQKKFANAKSISSAQFFGDPNKNVDAESQARISKFAVQYSPSVRLIFLPSGPLVATYKTYKKIERVKLIKLSW